MLTGAAPGRERGAHGRNTDAQFSYLSFGLSIYGVIIGEIGRTAYTHTHAQCGEHFSGWFFSFFVI